MAYETILYETTGAVARLTLNRPQVMNALDRTMFTEIGLALDGAERDDAVRAVVVTGAGRAFCAGVDLRWAQAELRDARAQEEFIRFANSMLLDKIEGLAKPVILAVNGVALAGGFEMVLAADFALAAEDALIGDQHMRYGLIGAGGAPYRLPLVVGLRKAKELILTGRPVTGREAERLGLVNRAVPLGELPAAVDALCAELVDKSPVTMRLSKRLLNRAAMVDLEARLEMAIMAAAVNGASEDYREGLRAFAEKRKPVYTGR
ncbi:MAG: hypothetical protein A2X52_20775 [Candidatus Rokubacteria bacterium GWC2_70_16]|nr:MAG: hypothetical protein A2X52_20775 [Candidatus Rokubacteria bacterium GWC2_70_16]OGL18284.1 MAG: hypothetical protein A3K12_11040 [Candidatus Rokubacteria bacterium RIFCSPLOWO2_12_FULL_71_19]